MAKACLVEHRLRVHRADGAPVLNQTTQHWYTGSSHKHVGLGASGCRVYESPVD